MKDAVTEGETEGDCMLLVGEGDRLPVFVEDADGLTDAVSEEDADSDADADEDSVIVGETVDESSVHPCRPPQYWQPSPAVPGSVKMSM